jgi:hypothetical protein
MMNRDVLELVAVLAKIGADDRELYRQLRAEAWAMAKQNHGNKTEQQREKWLANAS